MLRYQWLPCLPRQHWTFRVQIVNNQLNVIWQQMNRIVDILVSFDSKWTPSGTKSLCGSVARHGLQTICEMHVNRQLHTQTLLSRFWYFQPLLSYLRQQSLQSLTTQTKFWRLWIVPLPSDWVKNKCIPPGTPHCAPLCRPMTSYMIIPTLSPNISRNSEFWLTSNVKYSCT